MDSIKTTIAIFALSGFFILTAVAQESAPAKLKDQHGSVKTDTAKTNATIQSIKKAFPGKEFTDDIPVNFPAVYTRKILNKHFTHTTKGTPSAAVSISTADEPPVVYKWYQDKLKGDGWDLQLPTEKMMNLIGKAGKVYMLNATKEKQKMEVFCVLDEHTKGTNVSITWHKERK